MSPFFSLVLAMNASAMFIAALTSVSIVGNFIGTCLFIIFGIWISSLITGVPVAPEGYNFFKRTVTS